MKILIEAMCAEFGGIRTYVENMLEAWPSVFPDDELHVLVGDDSPLPTPSAIHRHEVAMVAPRTLGRPLAQTRHLPRLAKRLGVDVVLATLPSTSLRHPGVPTAVVVYDLRHELRPEQFSVGRRVLRRVSYARGYALADGIISISQRSLDDLHRLRPRTASRPAVVAHLGADHVDAWPRPDAPGPAITFAHHSNKNLPMILDAWELLATDEGGAPPLRVLGLGSSARESVAADLQSRGLTSAVSVAAFLPDDEFRAVMAGAGLVVFPSDFEGFGLPVAEAMRLGIPVVIGPEAATTEVAGGHAERMDDWSAGELAGCVRRARSRSRDDLAAAQTFAARYTWEATARANRDMLTQIAPRPETSLGSLR